MILLTDTEAEISQGKNFDFNRTVPDMHALSSFSLVNIRHVCSNRLWELTWISGCLMVTYFLWYFDFCSGFSGCSVRLAWGKNCGLVPEVLLNFVLICFNLSEKWLFNACRGNTVNCVSCKKSVRVLDFSALQHKYCIPCSVVNTRKQDFIYNSARISLTTGYKCIKRSLNVCLFFWVDGALFQLNAKNL